jgi:subtilisin-like proprotein convertase family protein
MFQVACKRGFVSFLLLVAVCLPATAVAVDFPGGNVGAIPDNNSAGRDVAFAVGGITGSITDVSISMTLTHGYAFDLRAELISPSGVTRRVVFGRTGANASGANSDLAGTYRFGDRFQSDWWLATAAAAGAVIQPGSYRASTSGASSIIKTGGCASSLTFAFKDLTPEQINGIWTLHLVDTAAPDAGSISAATLSLYGTDDLLFGNGFDSVVRGSCVRAQFDYTGSNRSSYVVVRNTGGGPGGAVTWFVRDNDGTATGFERSYQLGTANDHFVGGDFDGDGMWDPAVWTSGTPGRFTALLSGSPGAPPLQLDLGQPGDDPEQAGDYDGDGKADFALYRAGASSGDPSFMVIRLSSNGSDRILPSGFNGHFAAGGSDITGDGIADVAMQSNAGGGNAQFNIHTGTNGVIVDTFQFGTPTDVIICGNHSGNAQADVTVIRGSGGVIVWNTRDGATGTPQAPVNFGTSATDFALSSDFDGDGIDDYSVWRPNTDPALTRFLIRPSQTPGAPFEVNFGQNGDYPVGNARSH